MLADLSASIGWFERELGHRPWSIAYPFGLTPREAVRMELSGLPAVDLVLVARAAAVGAGVSDFRAWLQRAAQRMRGREGR